MYIFKNAWLSIIRNKGRNILMGVIIVVIACASAITLSIRNSANTLVEAYENKYNIEASISYNRDNLMKNFNTGSGNAENNINIFNSIVPITKDEIDNFGNSNYVDYYYYTYSIGMNSNDIDVATDIIKKETTTTTKKTEYSNPPMGRPGWGGSSTTTTTKKTEIITSMGTTGDFTLVGYSSYNGMSDFISGSYTITSGEISDDFTSANCVINSELATLNNLEVGDTITFVSVNNTKLTYVLTITGIYTDNSDESTDMRSMYSSSVNSIITNISVIEKMVTDDSKASTTITPTFILKNKDVADKFSIEVTEKGLSDNYQVTTNIDDIESETKAITNVSSFATTFLIITLIIGGVVLLILNMINVRERKYEIGVLRTIGMKKSSVTLQFTFELMAISLVGLLIGAGIGATSSVGIANKMLASEIESAKEESNRIGNNFFGNRENGKDAPSSNSSNDEVDEDVKKNEESTKTTNFSNVNGVIKISEVSNINAVVNFKVLIQLLGIGLLLTLFSSLASMISIAKFSPLTILKERS